MALNSGAIEVKHDPDEFEITDRDVIRYATGTGADQRKLLYLFGGDVRFAAFPTFAGIPPNRAVFEAMAEMVADLRKPVHGEAT